MSNPFPVCTDISEKTEKQWQFKPGVSGNPAGRPPLAKCITEQLRQILDKPEEPNARTVATALITKAVTPPYDTYAIKEIMDRVEGKVPLQVNQIIEARLITADISSLIRELNQSNTGLIERLAGILPPAMPQNALPGNDNEVTNDNGQVNATQ